MCIRDRPCACGAELCDGQAYRQAPNSYIDSLLLSITNRCNFRCRHCFVEAWKDRYGEFSREDLFCLLDQFEQANVADIALTGGEPLMSPHFKEFVRALAARRIGFTEIFTNAAQMCIRDRIQDLNEQIEYLMRPHSIMHKDVVLEKGWYRDLSLIHI